MKFMTEHEVRLIGNRVKQQIPGMPPFQHVVHIAVQILERLVGFDWTERFIKARTSSPGFLSATPLAGGLFDPTEGMMRTMELAAS